MRQLCLKKEVKNVKYVIIGNSAAAVGAVEGIRKNDKEGEITIISSEGYHTYSRPLISYLLLGKTTEEKMKYRAEDFYVKNNCKLLLNTTVTKIAPAEQKVMLDTGSFLSYDKLLVATGSSPVVFPIEGLDTVKHKFTFMSLDDAKALEASLTENARVLILGAGLIGLKCCEAISKKVKCICVDLSSRVLSSILDDESSAIIKKHLEDHGVEFHLNTKVKAFKENEALLEDGTIIAFDVLVLATGVRPNSELVQQAGGKVQRGIIIDAECKTSLPNIYGAGDCCESIDASTGERKVMALLPNAYMQGECAGINMSGGKYIFDKAIPMNAIGFFGKHIITAGNYIGDVYCEQTEDSYKKLYFSDNKLNGFILVGNIDKAGIYTSLIREKTPLDSLDFELICKEPTLIAFSQVERSEKLGGGKR